MDIDYCWEVYNQFIKTQTEKKNIDVKINNGFKCINCDYIENNEDNVCTNCGLIINNDITYECNLNYDNTGDMTILNYSKKYNTNNKISKMKSWYENTSEEKNDYKLLLYTKNICKILEVQSHIDYICDLVNKVLKCIKLNDGTKRSRVKDGIIAVCIYYTYKKHHLHNYTFSLQNIAKKLDLNIKYVSKAEMSILELINKNKIFMDKNILLNIDTSLNLVPDLKTRFIHFNKNFQIFHKTEIDSIFNKLEKNLKIYEKNDLLNNHAPLSISVGCLYFILKETHDINIMLLSNLYNISHITILKIYNIISTI